jgi:hypothetical protein
MQTARVVLNDWLVDILEKENFSDFQRLAKFANISTLPT